MAIEQRSDVVGRIWAGYGRSGVRGLAVMSACLIRGERGTGWASFLFRA